jgi:hypothetical protein
MQTRILSIAGLLCLSTLFFFCKKDNDRVEESPFLEFFKESSITIDTVTQSADTWEYGFEFTPLKSGKVTQFGVKIPANGDFTVTLWDLSGPAPVALRSKVVSNSVLNESSISSIEAITLQKGGKYGLTVMSNAFYRITRPGNATFAFPRTIGNIRIESFNEGVNNSGFATFPDTTNDTRVAPCVDVIFIAE